MTNMKFLFTSAYSGLGGGETIQLTLAEELTRRGIEAQLLVREEGEFAKRWRQLGQKTHIIPFRPASVYFVPALAARSTTVGCFAAVLRNEATTIVHADYHSLPYAAAATREVGISCIWNCMGWWFHPKPWQRAFFRGIALHFSLSEAARRGFLGDQPFMSPPRMCVLHPGVDTSHFQPVQDAAERAAIRRQYGFAEDAPLVLHVGRFQDVKGHDTFQEIARIVAAQIPTARFLVAGENLQHPADASYQRHILDTTKADPILRERLVYAGFVSEMQRLYPAADVAVCPSRFESYGIANLEAMACGIPVVSTNRGGPQETVLEGETGFLVPPRDAAMYAERVLRLLGDPDLRARMGGAGRRHIEAHFSIGQSADRFVGSCEHLLQS